MRLGNFLVLLREPFKHRLKQSWRNILKMEFTGNWPSTVIVYHSVPGVYFYTNIFITTCPVCCLPHQLHLLNIFTISRHKIVSGLIVTRNFSGFLLAVSAQPQQSQSFTRCSQPLATWSRQRSSRTGPGSPKDTALSPLRPRRRPGDYRCSLIPV